MQQPVAQRPDVQVVSSLGSTLSLTTITNSPTQVLKGTLAAQSTVTLSNANAFQGAKFRIKREATGAFNVLVQNPSATTLATLAVNQWADFEYLAGTGWTQTAAGTLL